MNTIRNVLITLISLSFILLSTKPSIDNPSNTSNTLVSNERPQRKEKLKKMISLVSFASHCVISGHRGLPSAKLFSDLDRMEIGDVFTFSILDQTLTYEVDAINVVEPNDSQLIEIVPEKDLVTLVTCTPYGINTHRLLVRGHRIENEKEALNARITADAIRIDAIYAAPFIAAPVLVLMGMWVMMISTNKKHRW